MANAVSKGQIKTTLVDKHTHIIYVAYNHNM